MIERTRSLREKWERSWNRSGLSYGLVVFAVLFTLVGGVYCLSERRVLPRGTVTLLARDGPCATYVVSSGPFGGHDVSYTHCDGKSETVTHSTECRTVLVGKAPLTVCDPVDRATEGE